MSEKAILTGCTDRNLRIDERAVAAEAALAISGTVGYLADRSLGRDGSVCMPSRTGWSETPQMGYRLLAFDVSRSQEWCYGWYPHPFTIYFKRIGLCTHLPHT